jgi:hypothetical protein
MKKINRVKLNCFIFLVLTFSIVLGGAVRAQENLPLSDENTAILRHVASLRDSLTLVRMISFENISVANQQKTAGI